MGPLAAALVLLSATLGAVPGAATAALNGEVPAMNAASLTRTRIFDHVSAEISAPGPWKIRTRSAEGWTDLETDTFAVPDRRLPLYELHFRASGLGPAGTAASGDIPAGARWRVTAETGTERREGFLVSGGPVSSPFRFEPGSLRGPHFELSFPGGSGFYENLRLPGSSLNLVDALKLRFDARLFGFVGVHRDETDFRWEVKSLETGTRSAVRRSEASVRALVRYVDPQPQNLFVCENLIFQKVELAIPELVMHLGADVSLRNGFEVPGDTEILLPHSTALEPLNRLKSAGPRDVPYDWILIAGPAGAVVHWLELPGRAANLHPLLYIDTPGRKGGNEKNVAGYRVEQIDLKWKAAAGADGSVILLQNVAVLGGPEWYDALRKPEFAAAVAKALDAPPSHWVVKLGPLP